MNTLHRTAKGADGIFGRFMFDGDNTSFMVTLEHAFLQDDGSYNAVIPTGKYFCVRGTHALHDGVAFETFEITGIVGHSGLLFHAGNFNHDSSGCVLCGATQITQPNGDDMITASRSKFADFMARLKGVDSFWLLVTEE